MTDEDIELACAKVLGPPSGIEGNESDDERDLGAPAPVRPR